jgi:hypothetical protein
MYQISYVTVKVHKRAKVRHVVPRRLDLGLRDPRMFGHLGGDPAGHVSAEVMDQVAVSIGPALRLDY